jgi:purine-binding chemotaxis protein CheW
MSQSEHSEAERILRERARKLARPAQEPPATEQIELLEFRLARERYAVESRHVQEVYPLRDLTPLPDTPPFLLGLVNVRGRILPVFDLRKLFELPEQGLTDMHRIVLVRGNDLELGLLADVIVGVHDVARDSLQPSLPTLTGIRAQYLLGVTDEHLIVLDLDRILADPRILIHDDVAS